VNVDKTAVVLSWVEDTREVMREADTCGKARRVQNKIDELRFIASVPEVNFGVFMINTKNGRRVTAGIIGASDGELLVPGCTLDSICELVSLVSKTLGIPVYTKRKDSR